MGNFPSIVAERADCRNRGSAGQPQDTEEIPTTSGETSPHNEGKKRPHCEGKGAEKTLTKQGEVLPKDKRALEATSSDSSSRMRGVQFCQFQH